jgi:hypothetical protein
MKDLIKHIKQVALDDIRLFFEPFVWVFRAIRRLVSAVSARIRRAMEKQQKDKDQ